MKKVWIVCIVSLILFMPKVMAEGENCEITRTVISIEGSNHRSISITIGNQIRNGYIYAAKFRGANGATSIGFCLDLGLTAGTKYVRATGNRSIEVTTIMRKAYMFAQSVNFDTDMGKIRYIVAQAAIWLDRAGVYSDEAHMNAVQEIINGYYGDSKANITKRRMIVEVINSWRHSTMQYTGDLLVYESKTNATNQQRFLVGLRTDICPETPPDPTNPDPDPDPEPTCSGYETMIVGNPAVCANDNSTHTGYYKEEINYETCEGDATEAGKPVKQLGEYCQMYCLEEVQQYYPGGISKPISLGTNLVWPTSAASIKTSWGNNYSLSYVGKKTCKVKIDDSTEINTKIIDFSRTVNFLSRYSRYSSDCSGHYDSLYREIENNRENAQTALDSAQKNLDQCDAHNNSVRICEGNKPACEQHNQAIRDCIEENGAPWCAAHINIVESDCSCSSYQNCTQFQNDVNTLNIRINNLTNDMTSNRTDLANCNTYVRAYNGANAILNELNSCINYAYSASDLYNFSSDTYISYNDPEFGSRYKLTGNTVYSCDGCNPSNTRVSGSISDQYNMINQIINNRTITITANATYALPSDDTIYKYIDKKTNLPLKTPIGNYISVGYSFLPTSYKADTNLPYELKIEVDCLGENCKFSDYMNDSGRNNYTCNYSVTSAPSNGNCNCPVGTDFEGKDLFPEIYNASQIGSPITCADAQLEFCNKRTVKEQVFCPPPYGHIEITDCMRNGKDYTTCILENSCEIPSIDKKYCPAPNDNISITSCLYDGNSYQYCIDTLCSDSPTIDDDYHCPNGTPGDWMDEKLHDCVRDNMHRGFENAKQYCKNVVCPGGNRIIYRTIDLYNPFPGKNAGLGTTLNFTLTNLKGRYPGSNWNSVEVVKKQILTNRGVEGDAVYQKEPLYSFVLDTNTVKEIRKYNDEQEKQGGYTDFTLDCSNGIACISSFVRNKTYGLVGGTCSNSNHSNFYECVES